MQKNMTKTVKEHLVRELAQGHFISGQALGEQLNISRAAISKHIKSLITMGLEIYSVRGKGYKLAHPLTLLTVEKVNQHLVPLVTPSTLEVHTVIDSTNSYLKRRLPNQLTQGQVCLAEYQSAGRGRRGRQWISPFGSHIYLSMYWRLEQGMSSAMGLSLVAALAVSDAIKNLYQLKVQLKWPNDIYLNEVKLAGILIELEGQALEACHTIIGIGLNIHMPAKAAEQIDQQWTDLQSFVDEPIDRNKLSAEIIHCLQARLIKHQQQGLSTMIDEWHQQDVYLNKAVKLITGEKVTKGICRGINTQGALLLEVDNQVTAIYGGEVSLRGQL